jgi:thioredoxin-like negative regulator of GroEL
MKQFIYFSADWCQPCRQLGPIMEEVAKEGITVQKIDVDKSPEMSQHYGVRNVPTVILLNEMGEEQGRKVGTNPKLAYLNMYNQN